MEFDNYLKIKPLENDFDPFDYKFSLGKNKLGNHDIIEKGINNLIENDPNETLMGLIELSDSLSIATENIGSNPNICKLMVELIKLFDKECVVPEVLSN